MTKESEKDLDAAAMKAQQERSAAKMKVAQECMMSMKGKYEEAMKANEKEYEEKLGKLPELNVMNLGARKTLDGGGGVQIERCWPRQSIQTNVQIVSG